VQERRVEVLGRAENRMHVDGVRAGERVAITGVERMRDGVAVCPPASSRPATAAATAAAAALPGPARAAPATGPGAAP
jgi:hypothetical protein